MLKTSTSDKENKPSLSGNSSSKKSKNPHQDTNRQPKRKATLQHKFFPVDQPGKSADNLPTPASRVLELTPEVLKRLRDITNNLENTKAKKASTARPQRRLLKNPRVKRELFPPKDTVLKELNGQLDSIDAQLLRYQANHSLNNLVKQIKENHADLLNQAGDLTESTLLNLTFFKDITQSQINKNICQLINTIYSQKECIQLALTITKELSTFVEALECVQEKISWLIENGYMMDDNEVNLIRNELAIIKLDMATAQEELMLYLTKCDGCLKDVAKNHHKKADLLNHLGNPQVRDWYTTLLDNFKEANQQKDSTNQVPVGTPHSCAAQYELLHKMFSTSEVAPPQRTLVCSH